MARGFSGGQHVKSCVIIVRCKSRNSENVPSRAATTVSGSLVDAHARLSETVYKARGRIIARAVFIPVYPSRSSHRANSSLPPPTVHFCAFDRRLRFRAEYEFVACLFFFYIQLNRHFRTVRPRTRSIRSNGSFTIQTDSDRTKLCNRFYVSE